MSQVDPAAARPAQALSLLDTTSIIVGIIIGSAIYRIAPIVSSSAGSWAVATAERFAAKSGEALSADMLSAVAMFAILGVWIVGGLMALVGAMCYAELATAYPQAGGTYVYLSEALGRTVGFAFAWSEFWIVRPGNIGAVAFVMADYGEQLLPASLRGTSHINVVLAAGAILILAALNAAGLKSGKTTQNILTVCKVVGLTAIVLVGLTVSSPPVASSPLTLTGAGLSLALIQIMFAYGGWADMSFVAAEVRQPERNIFRALLLGTATVTLIYVAVNWIFLHALGVEGTAKSQAVAAELMSLRFNKHGGQAISVLVVISCLGALNGMLLTGSRVFYALGTHHALFRWLGEWNQATGVPLRSLLLQTALTLGLVVGFGRYREGFERLVVFTAPFYWGFIALVGVALIVLRSRATTAGATFRVPLYPLTPLVFIASSGAMVYAAFDFAIRNAKVESWWAAIVVASGIVVGIIDWQARRR